MPAAQTLALFMAAALALNLTPGPDMMYVTARSVADGRRAGVVAALVHIAALALGLAALLASVPLAYDALRIAGALYLVVIGLQLLLRRSRAEAMPITPAPLGTVFAQAVLTNVFTPKVALFFLA